MPQLADGSQESLKINADLGGWRQGDVALEEKWFAHAANPALALTPESGQAEGEMTPEQLHEIKK